MRAIFSALVLAALGCSGNDAVDAAASVDACTTNYIPAIGGTVTDRNNAPILPSNIEACAQEQCATCRISSMPPNEVTYECSGIKPDATTSEIPVVAHEVHASMNGETWNFSVDVVRASNCHFETAILDLVLPPANE